MSGFISEVRAFQPPNDGVTTVDERLQKGDNLNSIPSDSGLLHSGAPRKHLTFREAPNNSVIQHYGSYIVLGTDRLGHLGRGAGASGFTNADAIDMVVGRGANLKNTESVGGEAPPGPAEGFIVGPLPTSDAARIYISSKSNIDLEFGLAPGKREPHRDSTKHMLSAVAMKADNVRLIARNNIKIVTGRNDGYSGGKEKNTLGGDSGQAGTISLIGGNWSGDETKMNGLFSHAGPVGTWSYLQPAIKGDYMVDLANHLFEYTDLATAVLFNTLMNIMSTKAAEIGDPWMSPISKMEKIRTAALDIPFGLEAAYDIRALALTWRRRFLTYGGDHHIRSPNVFLT